MTVPGRTLLADYHERISQFLEGPATNFQIGERGDQGVTDIKIVFEAYSLSAN